MSDASAWFRGTGQDTASYSGASRGRTKAARRAARDVRSRQQTVAALDIGTHKISCVIARDEGLRLRVLGMGQHRSQGIKAGAIVDMNAATYSIQSAVYAAEQATGTIVEQVHVNLSCGHPRSSIVRLSQQIGGQEITQAHIERLIEQAAASAETGSDGQMKRRRLHLNPIDYSVDYERGVSDPRGLFAEELGATIHLLTVGESAVQTLRRCLKDCRLNIASLTATPYASAMAALTPDERELGAAVVDLGAGTTSICTFHRGVPVSMDVLPVGGEHITRDIAQSLCITTAEAERLKTLYGSAIAYSTDDAHAIQLDGPGGDRFAPGREITRSVLTGIIRPRVEETIEMVREKLGQPHLQRFAPQRIVLTGGAARLPGIREYAAMLLSRQVRVGQSLHVSGGGDASRGPEFVTGAGLLQMQKSSATGTATPLPLQSGADQNPSHPGRKRRLHALRRWIATYF